MNLLRSQHRISQLLAVFVAQVKEYGAAQRTDINRVAESVLVPLFREVYGYLQLEDLNRTEGPNFAGIDLGDRQAKVAVQVTSTPTTAKVRHTLEQVLKRDLFQDYQRIVIYVLTEKQKSYPAETLSKLTNGRFDAKRDILDHRDLFRAITSTGLTLEQTQTVERLLEEHFGQPGLPFWKESSSLPPNSAYFQLLIRDVLEYLDGLALKAAELPRYYPDHLRTGAAGATRFDDVRQQVQVVEDRSAFDRWQAEELERTRAVGHDFGGPGYKPMRALPEFGERDETQGGIPPPPTPVTWDERAGERYKRAIILGDPGLGKSWLLHYEARRLAGDAARQLRERAAGLGELTLPVFTHLWRVNRRDAPFEDELIDFVVGTRSDAFRRFVREKLDSERCVILLDAWDEVPVEAPKGGQSIGHEKGYRQLLGERLENFAARFLRPRLLLTSRTVGYDPAHLNIPDMQELELLAFDSPQIESFVSVWFGDDARGASRCMAMLRQNPQVRGLARIPLMLTLLCRVYAVCKKGRRDFPNRRVELYDECMRGLLQDWREEKGLREEGYAEVVLELLDEVGYALFAEGLEQFGESDLRKKIVAWLSGVTYDYELKDPTSIITGLKRDGILINAGEHPDAPLLFLHRTFHENLVARRLAAVVNEEGWQAEVKFRGEKVTVRHLLDRKAWDRRWQEVIVLLVGRLRDPAPMLDLLADESGDDLFRHRLGLAALCLPELDPAQRARLAGRVDEITSAAFSLWWKHLGMHTAPALRLHTRTLLALGQVNGRVKGTPLLEHLGGYLSSENDVERSALLTVVGEMGGAAADPSILKRLALLLQDDDDWESQLLAAALVGKMGAAAATATILDLLAEMLNRWELASKHERLAAATAVSGFDRVASSALFDKLYDLILKDPSWDRQVTAEEIVEARVSSAAMEHARTEHFLYLVLSESTVRLSTRRILSEMGRATMPAVFRLLGYWLEARGFDRQAVTVKGISEMGSAARPDHDTALPPDAYQTVLAREVLLVYSAQAETPDPIGNLVEMLKDPEWDMRYAGLHCIGSAEVVPAVLEQLARILQDPHPMLRTDALNLVGNLGGAAATPAILDSLAQVLREDSSGWRSAAADAVRGIGRGAARDDIVAPLWKMLHDDNWHMQHEALIALCAIGAIKPPDILDTLAQMLQRGNRYAAVTIIRGFGSAAASEDVLRGLAQALRGAGFDLSPAHTGSATEPMVLEAIKSIGSAAATPAFLDELARMMREPDGEMRIKAAQALGRIIPGALTPPVLEQLVQTGIIDRLNQALQDPTSNLRRKAAQALGTMMRSGVYLFSKEGEIKPRRAADLSAIH
jgi:HEAT repeat protein